jgi:hypothetical protein
MKDLASRFQDRPKKREPASLGHATKSIYSRAIRRDDPYLNRFHQPRNKLITGVNLWGCFAALATTSSVTDEAGPYWLSVGEYGIYW